MSEAATHDEQVGELEQVDASEEHESEEQQLEETGTEQHEPEQTLEQEVTESASPAQQAEQTVEQSSQAPEQPEPGPEPDHSPAPASASNNRESMSRASSTAEASTSGSPAPAPAPAGASATEDAANGDAHPVLKRKRLPQDLVGRLEDCIELNPYDAKNYFSLIQEFKSKDKLDSCRQTYERLLTLYSTTSSIWVRYVEFELANNEFQRAATLFSRSLRSVLSLDLWKAYLDYVRRRQNLATGGAQAAQVVTQAFEFVLAHVGIDREATPIWLDYIDFLKSSSTNLSTWEQQQRNDQLRRTYQRAVVLPINNVESIWHDYDAFETFANRAGARKLLASKSPAYMTARAALRDLTRLTQDLRVPGALPEHPQWTAAQVSSVQRWRRWIEWEKSDPLQLEDEQQLIARVKYAYRQALMALRFYPEIWFEAVDYWQRNDKASDPIDLLRQGVSANPSSLLLAARLAETEEANHRYAEMREIYDSLVAAIAKQGTLRLAQFEADKERTLHPHGTSGPKADERPEEIQQRALVAQSIDAGRSRFEAEWCQKASMSWSVYINAVRRAEGVSAARQVFRSARTAKFQSYLIYISSALMEYHCSKDQNIAVRIFELGLRQFSTSGPYVLAYLDFFIRINDGTNARALYEKTVPKLSPEDAGPVHELWLSYQSWFGDSGSAQKAIERISAAYPDRPRLDIFRTRFEVLPGAGAVLGTEICPPEPAPSMRIPSGPRVGNDSIASDMDYHKGNSGSLHVSGPVGPSITNPAMVSPPALPPVLVDLLGKLPPASMFTGATFQVPKLLDLVRYAHVPETSEPNKRPRVS